MSTLRARMIEQMQLHRNAPGTQQQYVQVISQLAAYYKRSPDQLSPQDIRAYLHHLLTERQLAWSSCNVVAAAIRFFYVETLGWTPIELNLPLRPAQKHLPRVLSAEQLERLFATTDNPKHRALLMTAYAAGLRVSEVIRLRITDIESDPSRMLIRINHGKGNKDRYSLLSERLLVELHAYWKMERPRPWLFPCSKANPPMPSGTAQKVYNQARARAGIESGQNSGFHTLRHAFATHLFDAGVDPHTLQPAVGLSLHQNHLKVCPCQSPASDARQKPTRFALFRVGQSPSALGVRPCSRQSPARRTWTRGLLRPIALLKSLTSCAALPQAMPRPTPCLPLSSAYSMT